MVVVLAVFFTRPQRPTGAAGQVAVSVVSVGIAPGGAHGVRPHAACSIGGIGIGAYLRTENEVVQFIVSIGERRVRPIRAIGERQAIEPVITQALISRLAGLTRNRRQLQLQDECNGQLASTQSCRAYR